jgi:hypothetical protein
MTQALIRRLVTADAARSSTRGAHAAPAEQVVAGIDAVVLACTPVDPKSAKAAAELLERARVQRRLDLTLIRSSAGYQATYNAEVNRLLALPAKERLTACRNPW